MSNCLSCKHHVYGTKADTYYCKVRKTKIDILLESEECKSYERSEESDE